MAPKSHIYFLPTALLHLNNSVSVSETMKYVDCKYCDFHARSEASMEDHLEWEHKDKLKQDLEATDTSHADERIDGEENPYQRGPDWRRSYSKESSLQLDSQER